MKGLCKLCDRERDLARSHILPKSFTRRMRAGEPQVFSVSVESNPRARKVNGDYAQYLLCHDCEYHLKTQYEDYGTRLFVNRKNINETDEYFCVSDFDYNKYYLFVVGILWRASVSTLEVYRAASPLSSISKIIKPCILNNTLCFAFPHNMQLDDFIKISILRLVDFTGEIPQDILNSLISGINFERGGSSAEGLHYYFMVDGFLLVVSVFPPSSVTLKSWYPVGRLRNRRYLKIPKVSYLEIKQVWEGVDAIRQSRD